MTKNEASCVGPRGAIEPLGILRRLTQLPLMRHTAPMSDRSKTKTTTI